MNIDPPGTHITIPSDLPVGPRSFVLAGTVDPAWNEGDEIRVRIGTDEARVISAKPLDGGRFEIEVEGFPKLGPAKLGVTLGTAWVNYDVRED